MSRLRVGEWVALLASLGLFGVLFGPWFDVHGAASVLAAGANRAGWTSLGWFMDVLLAALIFGGIAVAATAVLRRSPTLPMAATVLTWVLGSLIWFVLLFVVVEQPGLGINAGDRMVSVQPLAYVGLVLAALIPLGAFLAMRDERTDAAESAYEPPPPRPIPEG
jgi:hypothetical protein